MLKHGCKTAGNTKNGRLRWVRRVHGPTLLSSSVNSVRDSFHPRNSTDSFRRGVSGLGVGMQKRHAFFGCRREIRCECPWRHFSCPDPTFVILTNYKSDFLYDGRSEILPAFQISDPSVQEGEFNASIQPCDTIEFSSVSCLV